MTDSRLNDWVALIDDDAVSRAQLAICQRLRPPLHGVEDCSLPDANQRLCREAKSFPSFCHVRTNSCIPGLRKSQASFSELAALNPTAPE